MTPRVNTKFSPLEPLPQPVRLPAAAFSSPSECDKRRGGLLGKLELSEDEDEEDDDEDVILSKVKEEAELFAKAMLNDPGDLDLEAAEDKDAVEDIVVEDGEPQPSGSGLQPPPPPGLEGSVAAAAALSAAPAASIAAGAAGQKIITLPEPKSSKSFSVMQKLHMKLMKKREASKENPEKKTIAKGTGYSSYHHKGWDTKLWLAAQKEKDRQIMMVLEKILEELKKFRRMTTVKTRNLPDLLFEAAGSSSAGLPAVEAVEEEAEGSVRGGKRKRKHSPDTGAAAPIDPISDLYAVLEGSALVPFLESRLQNSSFLEICHHTAVFKVNLQTVVIPQLIRDNSLF